MERNTFYCKDGKMAFFVPFTFSKENSFWNKWFNEEDLKNEDLKSEDEEKRRTASEKSKVAYRNGKTQIITRLKSIDENLFKDAQVCFEKCHCNRGVHYNGAKNLCSCMSINNKFHDDASQTALRTEMYLGSHTAVYKYTNNGITVSFSFDLNLYLSINKDDNVCFLILCTGLDSFKNNGIFKVNEENDDYISDAIIFWKHIFYKDRLKVNIDGGGPVSLRRWTTEYLIKMHAALEIETAPNFDEKGGIYFSYSIIELNNVRDSKDGKIISLKDIDCFLHNYSHHLYGLLVSDEGWKYVPDKYIAGKFKERYHSSRDHTYSFFIGHNALVINQLNAEGCDEYRKFGADWFAKYNQDGRGVVYSQYFNMTPCIPGLENHLLQIFMKSIYKNIMLERVMNNNEKESSIKQLESRIEKLTAVLESHSVLLGETQNIKDCIHKEFGLNDKLRKIKENYIHKTNSLNTKNDKEQNGKIGILTYCTIVLALLSLVLSLIYPDPSIKSGFVTYAIAGVFFCVSLVLGCKMVVERRKLKLTKDK
ncbi:MAG: hypothetical protein II318_01005 [Bacteroidales bacterium]|nr:hypothetical protein [Bacteroidales bacterium]